MLSGLFSNTPYPVLMDMPVVEYYFYENLLIEEANRRSEEARR
jgi:hypothetical protein